MGRKFMAVAVGMITALAIIWVAYMIGTAMAPFYPKNLEYLTADELAAYMRSVPASTYIVDLVGYAIAAFAGGFIATKMARRWSPGIEIALITGVLLTLGEILMAIMGNSDVRYVWPQPVWFIIASVFVFVPISLIGYVFAHRVGHTAILTEPLH